LNELRKWWLRNERTYLRLALNRLIVINSEVEKIENGSGIITKLRRLHNLPVLKSELKDLLERENELRTRLESVEFRLRSID